jgi:hypothetical protein
MSPLRPLSGVIRTLGRRRPRAEFDPYPPSGVDSAVMHKHSFQFSDVLS